MRCHSVTVVMPPSTSSVAKMLPIHSSRERRANHTPAPCISPSIVSVMLASRHRDVRTKAGRMDMDISKQLQLPRAAPRRSWPP